MTKPDRKEPVKSERAEAHEKMLKEALARPGIPAMMRVYGNWQEKDRGLDAWREVMNRRGRTVTTTDALEFD